MEYKPRTRRFYVLLLLLVLIIMFYNFHSLKLTIYDGDVTREIDWLNIKPMNRPPDHELHDKWIIITTINPPTDDVKKLSTLKDWKVVVVGDTKSPKNWR